MLLRLYVGRYSGYSQKVRIALAEKGLTETVSCVVLTPEEKQDPAYLQKNPLGLVPTLELEDGTCVPESTPIIEFLDARYPDPPLIPGDPLRRARMHALDRYNDQALTPAFRAYWDAARHPPPVGPDAAATAVLADRVLDVFRYLETVLTNEPYLVGDFSIADIAFMQRLQIFPAFGLALPRDLHRCRAWESRLHTRPSWNATRYPPLPPLS